MITVSVFKDLFDAPKAYYKIFILNLLGLQVLRYLTHNFFFHFLKFFKKKENNFYLNKLRTDGIVEINDFLSKENFLFVKKKFSEYLEKEEWQKNKLDTGTDWKQLLISQKTQNPDLKKIYEMFALNKEINSLIENSLYIKISTANSPVISFQKIVNPKYNIDDKDIQLALHSDRFYPCFKLFFTINSNDETNGAYYFSTGSHKFNFKRMLHEYVYSLQNSTIGKQKLKKIISIFFPSFKNNIKYNRFVPDKNFMKKVYDEEKQILSVENTLVISNNKGFHKRGVMKGDSCREQIRIVYYNLQKPFYYNFFKKIYFFLLK